MLFFSDLCQPVCHLFGFSFVVFFEIRRGKGRIVGVRKREDLEALD